MTRRTFAFLAPVCALVLLGQGCLGLGGSSGPADGGLFKSQNNGTSWQQLKTIDLGKDAKGQPKTANLGNLSTVSLAVSEDGGTLYLGTLQNGLLLSADSGATWTLSKAPDLASGRINAVAVSRQDKCAVYAARTNQIFKSVDCGKNWTQNFYNPKTDTLFTALSVDWFNPKVVYAGTSDGDVLRSDDAGSSWRVVDRVDGTNINAITLDPHDSRVVYVATQGGGILKSINGGAAWTPISKPFQDFAGARKVVQVVVDPNNSKLVYAISQYGLLKSADAGANWGPLTLPTPPGSVALRALTIHPTNSRLLIYTTDQSVVESADGGQNWTAHKPPTTRGVSFLLFDHGVQPALYLGTVPLNNG